MNKRPLIIIGKIPPPIGGVSVHVMRLINRLEEDKISFVFKPISLKVLLIIPFQKKIHLHSSNPFFRFVFSIVCYLFRVNSIVTIHGNLGRFNRIKNLFDLFTVYFSTIPIVLNEESINKAFPVNSNSIKISAFIKPVDSNKCSILVCSVFREIINLIKEPVIYCTNAHSLVFDKHGKEIYNIKKLIRIFNKYVNLVLVISDPSLEYSNHIEQFNLMVRPNIFFVKGPHDFTEVIKLSYGFIRATTTDGDSLSLKEALYFKKVAIASNVVSRPEGTLLFDLSDFNTLEVLLIQKPVYKKSFNVEDGYEKLKELYQN